MDGLYDICPAPRPFTLAGHTFQMMPLRVSDWAEMEQLLAARRKRPLDLVTPLLAGLSIDLQKHLLALAYRDERDGQRVPEWQIKEWMETVEGDLYSTWLMLRYKHPALTLLQVENLYLVNGQMNADQRAAKEAAEGMPIGNPFGATPAASPTNSPTLPTADTPPGADLPDSLPSGST